MPGGTDIYGVLFAQLSLLAATPLGSELDLAQHRVRIPETVVYQGGQPVEAYFSNAQQGGVKARQVSSKSEIYQCLLEGATSRSRIVASMIWFVQGVPQIRHLTSNELKVVVLGEGGKKEKYPPGTWVLQSFVGPEEGKAEYVSTIVATKSGNRPFETKMVTNRHKYHNHPRIHETALTVETIESAHVVEVYRLSTRLQMSIVGLSKICETCILNKLAKGRLKSSLTLYYRRNESNGMVWLMFATWGNTSKPKAVTPATSTDAYGQNSSGFATNNNVVLSTFQTATFACGSLWALRQNLLSEMKEGALLEENLLLGHVRSRVDGSLVECVQVTYDESIVSYADLLQFFWRQVELVDQRQNSSLAASKVIFYHTEQQRLEAEASAWRMASRAVNPLVASIEQISHFDLLREESNVGEKEGFYEFGGDPHESALHPFGSESPKSPAMSSNWQSAWASAAEVEQQQQQFGQGKNGASLEDVNSSLTFDAAHPNTHGAGGGEPLRKKSPARPTASRPEYAPPVSRPATSLRVNYARIQLLSKPKANRHDLLRESLQKKGPIVIGGTEICLPPWSSLNTIPYAELYPARDVTAYNNLAKIYDPEQQPTRKARLPEQQQQEQLQMPPHRPSTATSSASRQRKQRREEASADGADQNKNDNNSKPSSSPGLKKIHIDAFGDNIYGRGDTAADRMTKKLISKATVWSSKFGNKGREHRMRDKEEREQTDIEGSIPPTGLAEDLLDLVNIIVFAVCGNLTRHLSGSIEFADKHRSLLLASAEQQNSMAGGGSGSLGTRGPVSPDKIVTQDTMSRIIKYLKASDVSPKKKKKTKTKEGDEEDPATEGGGGGGRGRGDYPNDFDENDADDDEPEMTAPLSYSEISFAKALELLMCVPNHRPIEQLSTISLWLLSCTSNIESSEVRQRHDNEHGKKILFGFSEHSMVIRDLVAEASQIQSERSFFKDKSARSNTEIAESMRSWTVDMLEEEEIVAPSAVEAHSAASGGEDVAHNSTRKDKEASFSKSVGDVPATSSANSSPRRPSHPTSNKQGSRVREKQSLSKVLGDSLDPKEQGNDGESGLVKRLRKVRLHLGMQAFLAATGWPGPTLAPIPSIPLRQEVQQAFSGANYAQQQSVPAVPPPFAPRPSVPSSRPGSAARPKSAAMVRPAVTKFLPPLLDCYEEMPEGGIGELGPKYATMHGGIIGDEEKGDWPSIIVTQRPDDDDAHSLNAGASVSDLGDDLSMRFSKSMISQQTPNGGEGGGGGGMPSISALDRELLFLRAAPLLTARQRSVLVSALVVDMAQMLVVNISLLARHTWAGKDLTKKYVIALLGLPCVRAIGRKTFSNLMKWLKANKRSEASFKLGNPTLTDMALQRLFSYWPQLSIQLRCNIKPKALNSLPHSLYLGLERASKHQQQQAGRGGGVDEDEEEEYTDHPSLQRNPLLAKPPISHCIVAFVWLDRHRVDKVFAEPHLFQPNANII